MPTFDKMVKRWKEEVMATANNPPMTVGELVDGLTDAGYPDQSDKVAHIRDCQVTYMQLGEMSTPKDVNSDIEVSFTFNYINPNKPVETEMKIKPTNPLLIDVVENHLNSLPAGQTIQLSTTVDDIKSKVIKTHIVRTLRGVENEIISFTAFRLPCKTPDHEKTNLLNQLLSNVYRSAGSKSNFTTHQLLTHLETCEIDPVVGV